MKIIFFNQLDFYDEKLQTEFFQMHAPNTDVFCLQESYDRSKDFLDKLLPDFKMIHGDKIVSEGDMFPNSTYIHNSFSIVRSEIICAETRWIGIILYSQIKKDDHTFDLFNIHGVSKPGNKLDTEARIKQSQCILDFAKNCTNPVIIGGDFNLELNTKSVQMFEESGFKNLIKDFNITNTRNEVIWKKYPDTKQYYSDYIFTSPEIKVKSLKAPYSEMSDHLPLILEII